MPVQHSAGPLTYQKFVIDSGVVRKNFVDTTNYGTRIGATRGGATFTVKTELRKMPVDGSKGDVMGDKRIMSVTAEMEVEFLELSPEIIALAIPGATTTEEPVGAPTHTEMRRALQLALEDYIGNVALIGQISGSDHDVCLVLENALSDGNFALGMKDGDESTVKVKLTGHFDSADLDKEPWVIYFPNDCLTTEGA
jgi:hypothetical protein